MAPSRLGRRRVAAGVLALAALAALLRFWALGYRVFHWDEGRVGYWILRYVATGQYNYEPIIHGPFLYHVNRWVFGVVGASDFTARAVVALVGALLPLAAWLFRDHLSDVEVLALAGFLALNPVLLYYSRFMRNDVLVAAFAVFALGFFLRGQVTGRRWYWPVGTFFLALAFTTKANAVLYVLCWLGALVLVADHRVLGRAGGWTDRLRTGTVDAANDAVTWLDGLVDPAQRANPEDDVGDHVVRGFDALANGPAGKYVPAFVALALEFALVFAFFFAPRPDLWNALANPGRLPGLLEAATLGAFAETFSVWGGGHAHSYVEYLRLAVETHLAVALPLTAFAVAGLAYDRYRAGRRDFVEFCGYWGVLSIVGYPMVTDIPAHWSVVHSVVPLAVPAAVGLGWIGHRGLSFAREGDRVGAAAAVAIVVLVAGFAGVTAYGTSYAAPQSDENPLVQYGQPGGHMQDTLERVDAAAAANTDGTDVLFYGEHFYTAVGPSPALEEDLVEPKHWTYRLPLPWYFERYDASVDSTLDLAAVENTSAPVVIARAPHYDDLDPRLEGYTSVTYELTSSDTPTVVWIRNDTHEPAQLSEEFGNSYAGPTTSLG